VTDHSLRLSVLGGLALRGGERALGPAATQPRRLALLAVLAAAGDRGVSRDRLMLLFWPDSDVDSARNALKQAVFALRRDLGAPGLVAGTTELHLNRAQIACDAWDFEAALNAGDDARAVGLYSGPFLDGVHIDDTPDLDQWADAERSKLARLRTDALNRLASFAERAGDHVNAARWWRLFVEQEPVAPHASLGLMRSLAAAGDRVGALAAFAAHENAMRRELDLPADPGVRDLAAQIRTELAAHGPRQVPFASAAPAIEPPFAAADVKPATTSRHRMPLWGAVLLIALPALAAGSWLRARTPRDAGQYRSPRARPAVSRTRRKRFRAIQRRPATSCRCRPRWRRQLAHRGAFTGASST